MKSAKAAFKSFRRKIVTSSKIKNIAPNLNFGETIIPSSAEEVEIVLPNELNTYTYEILKTEALEANLKIACGGNGTFKSLTLRNTGGTLSLEPGTAGARLITLNPSLSEASKVDFLSEGNNWYSWGWLVGESLSATETPVYISSRTSASDADGDGLSNSLEAALGTDSGNSDSDGDNVGDGIEVATGTDPTDLSSFSDPNQDSDGDGFSDFAEILAGTNHLDPTSFPGATESTLPDPSTIGPVFTGIPNNLVIEAGTSEPDAKVQALIGVVANDPQDGNIPISITFSGYDGTHGNIFTATYAATDTDGNTTTVDKTFTVEDTVAPVITLLGDNPLTLTLGAVEGNDPGATTDDGSVVISDFATVIDNNSEVGEYTITYTSTDDAGNAATPVTRTVEIAEAASGLFMEELRNTSDTDYQINDNMDPSSPSDVAVDESGNIIYQKTSNLQTSYIDLAANSILDYGSVDRTYKDLTLSLWVRFDGVSVSSANTEICGFQDTTPTSGRSLLIRAGDASGVIRMKPIVSDTTTLATSTSGAPASAVNTWYHLALTFTDSTKQFKSYINGVLLSTYTGASPSADWPLRKLNKQNFGLGSYMDGSTYGSTGGTFSIDSLQIGDNVVLSDGQIAAIAAQADRQMTIDEASQLDTDAPTLTVTRNSDSLNIPDGSSITLNAGEVFEDLYTIEVSDNSGENITPVISPSIDTSSITGPNAHTITATDSAGNSTQITINIEVIGLWTERYENPTGAFYEDLNYSPSGITMVDSLSSNRYEIAAEMTGLTIDMGTAALDEGYEVIIDLRPVDTPIRQLNVYDWTNLDQASNCPLMIGFVRAPDTYTWNSANSIPINYSRSGSREWLAGCFYQARFSEADQNGTQMAYYHNPWDGNVVQSSAYLTWDLNNPGIPATDLIDQVRQVKYIIRRSTSAPNRMYFDIYTKLPLEQSWTTLKTGLWAAGPVALHLAIVGKSFPNGSIVQDISIQPWS